MQLQLLRAYSVAAKVSHLSQVLLQPRSCASEVRFPRSLTIAERLKTSQLLMPRPQIAGTKCQRGAAVALSCGSHSTRMPAFTAAGVRYMVFTCCAVTTQAMLARISEDTRPRTLTLRHIG